jgi:CHAD domain-containing protein
VTRLEVSLPAASAVEMALSPGMETLRSLLGTDTPTDPAAIHRARTATRRLRSNVRALEAVIETPDGLRADLAWVGESLGAVRDADVLADRLSDMVEAAPEVVGAGGLVVVAAVREQRRTASERVRRDLSGVRFGNLIHELDVLAKEASSASGMVEAADVMRPRWRALREAVRSLGTPSSDAELHQVRIATKRARYAAEIFQQVGGAPCRRFLRRATAMQDVLGAQHDASRACAWLLDQKIDDPAVARSTGWLAAGAAADRDALRDTWREPWRSLGRRKARFW